MLKDQIWNKRTSRWQKRFLKNSTAGAGVACCSCGCVCFERFIRTLNRLIVQKCASLEMRTQPEKRSISCFFSSGDTFAASFTHDQRNHSKLLILWHIVFLFLVAHVATQDYHNGTVYAIYTVCWKQFATTRTSSCWRSFARDHKKPNTARRTMGTTSW